MLKLAAYTLLAALAAGPASAAAFSKLVIPDPGNPPIQADVWYPSTAAPKPEQLGLLTQNVALNAPAEGQHLGLIVISHGLSGNAGNHIDTAAALADAGFVAVALTHTGDNTNDASRAMMIWERPRQLRVVLSYMLTAWPDHARIAPARIGAFGFSAGGFTVLVAAGATPDLSTIKPHCAQFPAEWTCAMIAAHRPHSAAPPKATPPKATPQVPLPASIWIHDPRIRAAIVAAPALGYSFGKTGLAAVHIPIQLWRAGDDRILPQPFYAQAVADDLPQAPEYHVANHAGHLDFLTPCSPELAEVAPQICTSEPGFSRRDFHASFNRAVVAFFKQKLP